MNKFKKFTDWKRKNDLMATEINKAWVECKSKFNEDWSKKKTELKTEMEKMAMEFEKEFATALTDQSWTIMAMMAATESPIIQSVRDL